MPVSSVARQKNELVTVSPDTPIQDVADLMRRESVGSIIVVRGDEPAGIVTDRDIALDVVGEGRDFADMTARDVMARDPVTVDASEGIFEACRLMRERSIRRLPVMEDDELVGIVTLDDLIVLLDDEMSDLSEVIRAESPPWETPETA